MSQNVSILFVPLSWPTHPCVFWSNHLMVYDMPPPPMEGVLEALKFRRRKPTKYTRGGPNIELASSVGDSSQAGCHKTVSWMDGHSQADDFGMSDGIVLLRTGLSAFGSELFQTCWLSGHIFGSFFILCLYTCHSCQHDNLILRKLMLQRDRPAQ